MRLNGHILYEAGDELDGLWSRERLIEMNARFTERLEEAFRLGLESRESAAGQVKLPASLSPRYGKGLARPDLTAVRVRGAADAPEARPGKVRHDEARHVEVGPIQVHPVEVRRGEAHLVQARLIEV